MAALSRDDVLKVANLGRLKLSDAEIDGYTQRLTAVIDYFQLLNEVDTTAVEPMVHAIELSNVFREDSVQPSLPRSAALHNSPKTDGQFFLVPEILDAK